ncbi:sulfatase-like hydrolase/transferase [Halorarum halophilum]|uniref:Sulfatase-like hydrolase/transferase n=1 Tax=Halorarum halophilum TaxID=2743090 RepID=A0A7D5GXA1_9EURY|nr:sulfatase-like hydrolase/transferase [Halobaculum halophilum]QLG27609.1 sulfatase-like hydrolase/transferase [Halobaculum halophilum]
MADSRPNVLFVLTDQERYDYTAPDGPPVETPELDRLSRDGVRFERAYTPTSICSSARASLLTGLYPHNHGMVNNTHEADAIQPNLPPDLPTFGEGLADVGYRNTYLGKWHVGRDQTPDDFGFSYLGGSDAHHDNIDSAFGEYRADMGVEVDEADLEDPIYTDDGSLVAATDPVPVEATRPYFLAERTIEELRRAADADAPFFHRTDFLGPHHPYVVPEPYASMYDPDEIELPNSYAETFDGKPQVHENYVDYRGVREFGRETWAEVIAANRGFMTLIDDQVGRVLNAIDDLGLTDDTVVAHASDHGDFVGGHRQFNKGPLMYEDTYHVPLQIRWPGVVESGSVDDVPVRLHDLMPTFLDVCDAPIPDGLDARSLRPLLEGDRPDDWPEAVVSEYHGDEFGLYTQRMIHTGDYKYVFNSPDVDELYDLRDDPAELQNLIEHPDFEAVRRDLRERLVDWMHGTDDPLRQWGAQALG